MRLYFVAVLVLTFAACKRNTVPSKPTTSETRTEVKKPAEPTATVMVDGDGKVVNSSVKTTTGTTKVYPVTSVRSFTPNQKKNLMYRFKTVPPKVLNVPESLAKKNAQGTYYIYKTKFWYWKKADGFFYLDENYYN